MNRVSIIIPAQNEEKNISSTIKNITQSLQENCISYEVIVINDGSNDKTEDVVLALARDDKDIVLVNNPGPYGLGNAIRLGLQNFHGDAVIISMADGSEDSRDFVSYVWTLDEGYDCCFGSRWMKGGATQGYPVLKYLLNRLGNFVIRFLFGIPYNDITNAFKGYSREVIDKMQPLSAEHFDITIEMPLKAIIHGAEYKVIPIKWYGRKEGKTKLILKEMGSNYLKTLLKLYKNRNVKGGRAN